ncbi:hypothetical protein HDV04_001993 [Boothiomyces sp. JEL0838]|nr:hypothetical protein HDV04_001993 [Boothiomyces sp. JEL0838]
MVQTRSGKKTSKTDDEKKPLLTKMKTKDINNIILLVILYLLQGVPLGLSFGSVPYLLKSKLNYSDLALFSLSSYPYSLKLLWSPIVDSLYFKSIGRRKSWILPIQFILGVCLVFVGYHIDELLEGDIPVTMIAVVFTIMTYASTAQTIGLNTGYFLSFTVFLAFNSPEFCNAYIRSVPSDSGLLTLGQYLFFWGVMFLICDFFLLFFTETADQFEEESISSVYKTIIDICQMKHMQTFIGILMICKIGFQANEAVTGLKLLELGFNKEYLALSVLLDFPLQMIFGYYAAKWSSGKRPLLPWLYGFYGRLLAAVVGMAVVYNYPKEGVTTAYLVIVMSATVLSSFMNTIQFVGMGSFFTKISDPAIAVDYFTVAPCSVNSADGHAIKCADDKHRDQCKALGGSCNYIQDGYYYVNTACFIFGLLSLLLYIKPQIKKLEGLSDDLWRLSKYKKTK